MSKYLTLGNVTALLSVMAILAGAFGKSALKSFLDDPSTAQSVMTMIGALLTLVAGASKGIQQ